LPSQSSNGNREKLCVHAEMSATKTPRRCIDSKFASGRTEHRVEGGTLKKIAQQRKPDSVPHANSRGNLVATRSPAATNSSHDKDYVLVNTPGTRIVPSTISMGILFNFRSVSAVAGYAS
jgi:hypothetical protein